MNTKEIARGAMVTGIYGLLLVANQQFSLAIESSMNWIFAFPVLVYTAMYGLYPGGMVLLAMAGLTFFFGGFTTWFYAWSALLIGYIYGVGIIQKWSAQLRIAITMLLSFLANVCIMVVWASIFGIDYTEDLAMIARLAPWMHIQTYMLLLCFLLALLQTCCIHMVAVLLCGRLKVPIAGFAPIYTKKAPGWLAIVSVAVFLMAGFTFGPNMVECSKGLENFVFVLVFLDLVILEYYGVLWFFMLAVKHQKRWMAALAVLGAFIPGLNFIWALTGWWSSARTLLFRKR